MSVRLVGMSNFAQVIWVDAEKRGNAVNLTFGTRLRGKRPVFKIRLQIRVLIHIKDSVGDTLTRIKWLSSYGGTREPGGLDRTVPFPAPVLAASYCADGRNSRCHNPTPSPVRNGTLRVVDLNFIK
jgi:hypothetical protein